MPKGVIVVLVAVVLVFAVTVGIGVSRGDASPDPQAHGWLGFLEFGGAPGVDAEGIASSECFDAAAARFAVGGPFPRCTSEIAESDDRSRLLRLEVVQAEAPVTITLEPHDSDGVGLDGVDFEAGESTSASVGRHGARLTIDCPSGCIVILVR